MARRLPLACAGLLSALACAGAAPAPAAASPPPWKDGEVAAYRIRWGPVVAAQAVFTARTSGEGQWRFDLDLAARGVVTTFYPFHDTFRSITQGSPWRSVEFREDRRERGKTRQTVSRIDYARRAGLFRDETKKKSIPFAVPDRALDDLGSMVYGVRRVDWREGLVRPLRVHDGGTVHPATAAFLRRETIAVPGVAEPVPCRVVVLRPVYTDPRKTARDYHATLWLRDDAGRLPVRADLKARFGTVTLEWLPDGPTPPEA